MFAALKHLYAMEVNRA